MTEPQNGRDELLMDLDAFSPPAGQRVKFRGKLYTIRNFNDLAMDDQLLILRIQVEMQGKKASDRLEMYIRYMAILCPEMDRATLGGLNPGQAVKLMRLSMGAAEVPPVADAAPSDSPTASPSSADSTDGAGARSES